MIELRWLEKRIKVNNGISEPGMSNQWYQKEKVLQYRKGREKKFIYEDSLRTEIKWSEWKDVPTEEE